MTQLNLVQPDPLSVTSERAGLQLAYVQCMLALIACTSSIRLNRPIPAEDLLHVCEQVGIHPMPATEHDAAIALLRVAPGLLRVFRAPLDHEQFSFEQWKAAVERGEHLAAHAWLYELGLSPLG